MPLAAVTLVMTGGSPLPGLPWSAADAAHEPLFPQSAGEVAAASRVCREKPAPAVTGYQPGSNLKLRIFSPKGSGRVRPIDSPSLESDPV